MRTITSILVSIVLLYTNTYAAIYLEDIDNRDISGSSGSSLPSSNPVIIGDNSTGTTVSTGVSTINEDEVEGTNPLNQLPELQRDAEFLMSLRRIYDQGITKFQDPDKFMPENYLTRVDAAKMLSILSRKVFGTTTIVNQTCAYVDISGYDTTTQGQVKDACQLGIFKPASSFNPNQGITKGQLIAVLLRMFDRKTLDETISPRYKNYIQRGGDIGLLSDKSLAGMDDTVTRMDVAKLLYKLRNLHLNKTPVSKDATPLFIHIITNSGEGKLYQALIDTTMLRDDYLKTLEMKMDTVTYYFEKDKIYNYGSTLSNFQVYGYIYASSESITPIGVGTRRVQKGIIQEGSLVIRGTPQTIYSIKPNDDASLYIITKSE